jgi:cell wall-associated NlpC family hydrolase
MLYRRHIALVLMLAVSAGCASRGATPRPFPVPGGAGRRSGPASPAPPGGAPAPLAASLVRTALALRGAPYRNGGADPSGFDCSGFVWYVFSRLGLTVPRTVAGLYLAGVAVEPGAIAPGDLMFFTTTAPGPSHVGIALDAGRFVHAPSSRGVVRVEPTSSPYWSARYLGARRFDPAAGAATPTLRGAVPYR